LEFQYVICYTLNEEGITWSCAQMKKIIIIAFIYLLFVGAVTFAQDQHQPQAPKEIVPPISVPREAYDAAFARGADISLRAKMENGKGDVYWSWLNSAIVPDARHRDIDKKELRQQWEELMGVDVFMPYFKMKEVEDYFQARRR